MDSIEVLTNKAGPCLVQYACTGIILAHLHSRADRAIHEMVIVAQARLNIDKPVFNYRVRKSWFDQLEAASCLSGGVESLKQIKQGIIGF